MIAWQELTNKTQWSELIQLSRSKPIIIFKHSTRCGISGMVYNRLNAAAEVTGDATWIYLDLIKNRDISNLIETETQIEHESPQIIVIWQGKPVYHASHTAITMQDVLNKIKQESIQN